MHPHVIQPIRGVTAPGRRQAGVTLIELMIALAVIGILAAIAYPSYQDHVRRGNRAEAKGILLETAQFMERNYTTNGCYHRTDSNCANATVTTTVPFNQSPKPGAGTARYNISFQAIASQSFTLQAVPTGTMTGDACGTLTLSNTGAQGAGGAIADCWQR